MEFSEDWMYAKVGREFECKVQCNGWVAAGEDQCRDDEVNAPGA